MLALFAPLLALLNPYVFFVRHKLVNIRLSKMICPFSPETKREKERESERERDREREKERKRVKERERERRKRVINNIP